MIDDKTDKYSPALSIIIVACVTLACLVPFVNKAYNIDDPLFLWCARHIQNNPFDFYGFSVNWEGYEKPFSLITQNPPLASYYTALIAYFFGWSEVPIHLAFIANSLVAAAGIYYLSKSLCSHPLTAALTGILTPVFLLSSTNIMCDVMMLSFWVWSVYFWMYGIKNDKPVALLLATVLIGFCGLTKYYGMSLIPLLLVYSIVYRRRPERWMLLLLIPIAILGMYQWITYELYGKGLLVNAVSYASNLRVGGNYASKVLSTLAFSGGGIITALFYTPLLWTRKNIINGIIVSTVVFIGLIILQNNDRYSITDINNVNWSLVIQFLVLSVAGMNILVLAIIDLWQQRNADSALLFLWIAGTFIFSCFLNWTVSGRNILPMAPAVGIVLIRRFEYGNIFGDKRNLRWITLLLALSLLTALSVNLADYKFSNTAREAAQVINDTYRGSPNSIWFQGHWGFQYYMERRGSKPLDVNRPAVSDGDIIIVPLNNSYIHPMDEHHVLPLTELRIEPLHWLTTMNGNMGAGYYSDGWGQLPFVLGSVPAETYYIYTYHLN
jgi:4-amino-4-deoxy-L-arabinose transferase-like glycosyltransferase